MKLGPKIGFSFFTATVIPTSILISFFYLTAKSSLEGRIYEHLTTTAESKKNGLTRISPKEKAILMF